MIESLNVAETFSSELFIDVIYFFFILFSLMAKMNHSRPDHDRHNAYHTELSDPVYENVTVSVVSVSYSRLNSLHL